MLYWCTTVHEITFWQLSEVKLKVLTVLLVLCWTQTSDSTQRGQRMTNLQSHWDTLWVLHEHLQHAAISSAFKCTLPHITHLTLHNGLPCLCFPLLCNAARCNPAHSRKHHCIWHWDTIQNNCPADTALNKHCTLQTAAETGVALLPWLISHALTYDGAKLWLILQHGNYHRNPLLHPRELPEPCCGHENEMKLDYYLSRLGSGMEPEPEPSIPFFPLNNFSTRATFPVRAASSSSCSFPILNTSLKRRGEENPANIP